jgi:3-deoxy-7-phosphoheptulonate synthase
MLIILRQGDALKDAERVRAFLARSGLEASTVDLGDRLALSVVGVNGSPFPANVESLPEVERVVPVSRPPRLAAFRDDDPPRGVRIGDRAVGAGRFAIIAGPCAVEDEGLLLEAAAAARDYGADMLRGGAFKPRSSPYSFQGLGARAYEMLARAGQETGLPVVSEVMDQASLSAAVECIDLLQVGSRNMQNFNLLRLVGRSGKPVLLKRGMSATLEDLLLSAEYVLSEGNQSVILCERGIRTFSGHSRFTLDLSLIPALREVSHLPIVVDPSHAVGRREGVPPMARAAAAAGADGVMIEVHPDPARALSDGAQALRPEDLARLVPELRSLVAGAAPLRETGA